LQKRKKNLGCVGPLQTGKGGGNPGGSPDEKQYQIKREEVTKQRGKLPVKEGPQPVKKKKLEKKNRGDGKRGEPRHYKGLDQKKN